MKGSVAAIHFMLVNSAKYNVDSASFEREIQQLGLPKANAEMIVKKYENSISKLREKFAKESYRFNGLKYVDWRVDHVLASSSKSEAEVGSIAHLKLSLHNSDSTDTSPSKTVAFEISPPKLDVMIFELSKALEFMKKYKSS